MPLSASPFFITMKYKLLLLLALVQITSVANAQIYKNEFGFQSDNDAYLFYGQDRYYTNGLFINFRHASDQSQLKENIEKKIWEVSVGQKMFNPSSGYAPDPARHDRPFAGYLYASGAMSWFFKNESMLKTGLQVGVTGKSSIAEAGQKFLHKTVGFYPIQGWDYQVAEEVGATLSAQYTRLLQRAKNNYTDFSLDAYANAGTMFNAAGVGVLFRAGDINQLFNSSYTNSVIGNKAKTKRLVGKEIFFYAKPQINLVAYDATLQGSMFNDDSPVTFDPKPIVFAQQLGLNYSTQRFTLDFNIIFKSKEVKSEAKPHQYGSISMYYRFN